MSALTAIRNPANQEETLVFFCTTDQNVGFSVVPDKVDGGLRDGEDDDETDVPLRGLPVNTGESKLGTLVAQPGAFASVYFNNLVSFKSSLTTDIHQKKAQSSIKTNGYSIELVESLRSQVNGRHLPPLPRSCRPAQGTNNSKAGFGWMR